MLVFVLYECVKSPHSTRDYTPTRNPSKSIHSALSGTGDWCEMNHQDPAGNSQFNMATFLAFKGAVLKFSIGNTDQNDEKCISTEVFKFCKSSKCFKRSAEKVLRLTVRNLPGHKCELDSAKCLLNTMSGVCQPSLLLCHLPRKHTGRVELSVFVMEDYDSLSLLGRFSVDQTQISRLDFHFIDGPSVCWTSEGAVYQAKYDSQLEKFTLTSIALGSSMKEQPRADFTLHWCGVLRGETVAMGATFDSAQQPSRWMCINLSRRDIHEISLVPSVYVPIATCLSVRETFPQLASDFTSISSYHELEIYLATKHGQLLKFVSRRLQNCWQLPFSNPSCIFLLEVYINEARIIS